MSVEPAAGRVEMIHSLMLERHHLLDGHLVARHGVGGGDDHAVGALAEELQVVVAGTNLK